MKSLQTWYRELNGTYLDRNFYRSPESIFAHLVEVSRGLCVAATKRRKRDLEPEEYLPKSLAWWLTLCGRAGVPNVEEMLWAKFPSVCAYCQLEKHEGRFCKENDATKKDVKWAELKQIGTKQKPPTTLALWQQSFNNIYPRDDSTGHEINIYRLSEELGELAEAVRVLPLAPQYFVSEAPDVFAWLMGFANQFDFDRGVADFDYGSSLEKAMLREYPGHCKLCERHVCKCPPIPAETLGRIAKEAPLNIVLSRGGLFSTQESVNLFRRSAAELTVGEKEVIATSDELLKISADIQLILDQLSNQNDWKPRVAVSLAAALGALQKLTQQGEVTQQAVDNVLTAIRAAAPEEQSQVLTFPSNVAASETFHAIALALGIRAQ
jgi:NTP pyrophosphatase (non-canonical NTP hydrolase)